MALGLWRDCPSEPQKGKASPMVEAWPVLASGRRAGMWDWCLMGMKETGRDGVVTVIVKAGAWEQWGCALACSWVWVIPYGASASRSLTDGERRFQSDDYNTVQRKLSMDQEWQVWDWAFNSYWFDYVTHVLGHYFLLLDLSPGSVWVYTLHWCTERAGSKGFKLMHLPCAHISPLV